MQGGSYCYPYPHPAVTTDVVLFTIQEQQLRILLIQRAAAPFSEMWALPGGFLEIDEDLETCAARELEEETGITGLYLEQLYTFGTPERDPRERVISVTYYALVQANRVNPRAASDARQADWFPIGSLPDLAFDHADIIELARRRLVAKLDYSSIAFQFMPETFTLSELQSVYEILLNRRLDKRNFRKRILAQDLIQATGRHIRSGSHRPARTYRAKNPERVVIVK
ncbi:MAG: NUDIX domain-containing protein [Pseudomonadota bacterium]